MYLLLVTLYVFLHHCFEFWAAWFTGDELEIEVNYKEIWLIEMRKKKKYRISLSAQHVLFAEEQQYLCPSILSQHMRVIKTYFCRPPVCNPSREVVVFLFSGVLTESQTQMSVWSYMSEGSIFWLHKAID